MDAVTAAFKSSDPATLESVWRALFSVQASVLEHQGSNDFGVPHEGDRNVVRTETTVEARYVNRGFVTRGRRIWETRRMD